LKEILSKDMQMICDSSNVEDSNKYYYIKHANGRCWLVPCSSYRELRVALAMYQPLTFKGVGFKRLFPYLASNKAFQKNTKVGILKISFRKEFLDWVEEVFETRNPLISIFQGSPGVHRKITFQVSDQNLNILGYIKFTSDLAVAELISAEADFLTQLSGKNLAVPFLIGYEKDFLNGLTIMAQTTKKTLKSNTARVLNQQHFDFQRQLFEKTKVTMKYCNTQYFNNKENYLLDLYRLQNMEDKRIITLAVDVINRKLKDSVVTFSVSHRDFTPPNTCFTNGRIFVFDWEYAACEYPPFYDLFAFITFTTIQKGGMSEEKILHEIEKLIKTIQKQYKGYDTDLIKLYYLMFLIDMTFVSLSKGLDIKAQSWIGLVRKVISTSFGEA
jgi:hypothetical protein